MKALEILDCIMYMGISGDGLTKIEVPEEGYEWWQQNENWWLKTLGSVPPYPIESGTYIAMLSDQNDWLMTANNNYEPDCEVEMGGGTMVYLYKVED